MTIRAICIALFLLAAGCGQESERVDVELVQEDIPREVTPASDFTLLTPEGEAFSLADHRGEIVVINFWATWCLPCVVEIPDIEELHQEYGDRGVVFVGISQDTGESAEVDVRDFREMFDVTYPLVLDPELIVARMYDGVTALPTTIVIDPEGNIHARRAGLLRKSDILNMFSDLLT